MPIQRAKPRFTEVKNVSNITANQLDIGQIGGLRNIVINGSAQCWQRATSSSSTGYTSVDRWSYYAPSSLAISRSTDVPTGFQYAISVGGGGDSSGITQKIEASTCKQLVGKTVTVSFYLKQTTGSGTDKIAVALSRANSEDSFGGTTSISSQTISTTSSYVRYTCTFTSLPSEVANGLQLTIKSNGSGSVVYLITGIQLEVGSVATPFEHRSFAEEFQLCQRYYQEITGSVDNTALEDAHQAMFPMLAYNTTLGLGTLTFTTPMRGRPALGYSAVGHFLKYSAGRGDNVTGLALYDGVENATTRTAYINVTSGNSTAGGGFVAAQNTAARLNFDAEL